MASKKYIMVADTETANGLMENGKLNLTQSLVYDIGFVIVDKKGNVYERRSMAIADIFCNMKDIMKSAYYAEKIPSYWEEICNGSRELVTFMHARDIVLKALKKYNITTISAHNARFDINALNNTIRYITKSEKRFFFPYGIEIWDTYKGAMKTICTQKGYIRFCERNGYMTKHRVPQVRLTAEILYRYISGNNDFDESHTGLEDVLIETKILVHCFRQHKPMEYRLFAS